MHHSRLLSQCSEILNGYACFLHEQKSAAPQLVAILHIFWEKKPRCAAFAGDKEGGGGKGWGYM